MIYLSIADIEAYTGQTYTPEQQSIIDAIENACADFIHQYCNRNWLADTYTELFDGGTSVFFLQNGGSISETTIDSITIDGDVLDADQFANYGSHVKLLVPAPKGLQNVSIEYTVDSPLPYSLTQALIQWVVELYNDAPISAGTSTTTNTYSDETISAGFVIGANPGQVQYYDTVTASTTPNLGTLISYDRKITTLYLQVNFNDLDGETFVTLCVNGVETDIKINVQAAGTGTFAHTSHTVDVIAGDMVQIKVDASASTTGSVFEASYSFSGGSSVVSVGGSGSVDTSEVKRVSVGPVSVEYGSSETEGAQSSSSTGALSSVPEYVADILRLYRRTPI